MTEKVFCWEEGVCSLMTVTVDEVIDMCIQSVSCDNCYHFY
jgi:hypothetical protein